jgi:spermidine/putrescine-binding protein
MIRRVITAAALAAAATFTAIVPAAPASARACTINFYCFHRYYADAAHTVLVGQRFEDCDGSMSMWGTFGPYATFSENPC